MRHARLPRVRPRGGRRLFSGLLLLIPILAVPDASVASELSGARLAHTPPDRAIAGDPLDLEVDVARACGAAPVCAGLQVVATYGSPEAGPRTVVAEVQPGDGKVKVVVTIPGEAVRYPGLTYQLAVSAPELGDAGATDVHSYEVPVAIAYRVGFRYPDGLPAADATVVARSAKSALWVGRTDARGNALIDLAGSEFAAAYEGADYSQLFITAFDAVPQNPTGSAAVDGNGSDIATFANLGNLLLDAVDTQVQDRVFVLQPQTRDFSPPMSASTASTTPYGCQPFPNGEGYVCTEILERIYNVNIPLVDNVGGGSEMNSNYTYTDSTFTTTGVLVKAGSSWVEAEGETTAEQRTSISAGTGDIGPNTNVTVFGQYNFLRERETWCHQASCSTTERVRPEKWNGGFWGADSPHIHDKAAQTQQTDGSDCVIKVYRDFTSEASKGKSLRFSISVEGGPRSLKARTRYLNDRGSSSRAVHIWRPTGATRNFHHVFVKYGIVDWENTKDDKCPDSHPELTWTDSSDMDKSIYGPPSRHTTGDVHHGLMRSVNSYGPDRIHGWTSHPHGSKDVIVRSCETEMPCRMPSEHGLTSTWLCSATSWYWEPVGHVHCEANIDHPSAASLHATYPEPEGNWAPCQGGEPYPVHSDGHGIDCHVMRDVLTNGPGAE